MKQPVTTSRVRLQMIQGEQNGYTTRIYEFAVYGYLQGEDPNGINDAPRLNDKEQMRNDNAIYDLSGRKWSMEKFPKGVYITGGKKVLR